MSEATDNTAREVPARPSTADTVVAAGEPPSKTRLWPVLLPILLFAAMAGMFAMALRKGDPSRIPSALIGRTAPQLTLAPVEGLARGAVQVPGLGPADLTSGRPAVVNFFASWCLPCEEEHPQLVALARRTGVALLGINHKDQPANARRFLERHGNPYAAVGSDANGRAAIEWGVYGMPETFIVDGQGTVVFKHVGPISAEVLDKQLLPALRKAGLR